MEKIIKNIVIDVVILTLNEEKYIQGCLESVLGFELPKDTSLKIFIVDGGSTDNTICIAQELISNSPNIDINILVNKGKIQSKGLNKIIKEQAGDFILRLDAHSVYDKEYLKNCLETSLRTNADNVGGILHTFQGNQGLSSSLVHSILTHPFGMGSAGYRRGAREGPTDTVHSGFFRRDIFTKVGRFDERLVRAQDYELNKRILKSGGKIWLNPKIKANYFIKQNLIDFYKKILFLEAPYNSYMWCLAPYTFSIRHSITAFFVLGILIGPLLSLFSDLILTIYLIVILFYCLLAILSSLQVAIEKKDFRQFLILPLSFFIFHLTHGAGVIYGLLNFPFMKFKEN